MAEELSDCPFPAVIEGEVGNVSGQGDNFCRSKMLYILDNVNFVCL